LVDDQLAKALDVIEQAQDVYRQALGAIVLMTNVSDIARVKEIGRAFLRASGAKQWARPDCVPPMNQRGRK